MVITSKSEFLREKYIENIQETKFTRKILRPDNQIRTIQAQKQKLSQTYKYIHSDMRKRIFTGTLNE